ncbi:MULTISPECIES: ABC transporter substrate-binding protein [Mameliella]|uniref:Sugar ABC transporter substrate-binding protein n=1 Tax=Mameliella alba TaxID=561184 RepID=A0A0B3S833_9RHOB|nr:MULTISPECIES: sugar ABC transporter substrate-binding protein [Mameliella]ODM48473.1 sugar ABC transporter substrate-binding protein [Ruegeria sp. PBVC088]KHQ52841.1 Sugar ABC transporter substrate-binding protein [Mameliella alba]MBY6120732.1 sugar ABC transporter substrate-binding protein [Mameliella alba]MDD9732877.1 sugar ABC transporter substrate-binding protein [Mameliella sp. AT18]OWV42703.1 sugar ABC transporter substrate-binding protein [Mameliella alba]
MTLKATGASLIALAIGMASGASAAEFDGVVIDAKLIGGQQYEALYARIAEWEEMTGATVNVISKKNHFELDKEFKSDIAARTTGWCVGSNHSSFASQYPSLYTDLSDLIPQETIDGFVKANIDAATLGGKLVMLPRAQFDVSALYYQKDIYEDAEKAAAFEAEYGYPLAVPETWDQLKDQAIFFADPPNFYGTQYAGKDEAIVGRFYELVVANGGKLFNDDFSPAFNSDAGKEALQWFVDLYEAGAVPAGTTNYLWDDLGNGFASGTIALNLDWPGWAGFFNDPSASKVAGNVGVAPAPKGSAGVRTGWSGFHGFSVTENCDNKEAAASLVAFLTNEDSQKLESSAGPLPSRTAVWDHISEQAKDDPYRSEVLAAFKETAATAFAVPPTEYWIEATNLIYPELQAAILGDKTVDEALADAADAVDSLMQEEGVY